MTGLVCIFLKIVFLFVVWINLTLSGHILLNILSGFTYNINTSGFIFFFLGFFPLAFIIAYSVLELAIAFIQAQVFVVLSCSYVKDALELH